MAELAILGVLFSAAQTAVSLYKGINELKENRKNKKKNSINGADLTLDKVLEEEKSLDIIQHLLTPQNGDSNWDSYDGLDSDMNNSLYELRRRHWVYEEATDDELVSLECLSRKKIQQLIDQNQDYFKAYLGSGSGVTVPVMKKWAVNIVEFVLCYYTDEQGKIKQNVVQDAIITINKAKYLGKLKEVLRKDCNTVTEEMREIVMTSTDACTEEMALNVQAMVYLLLYSCEVARQMLNRKNEAERDLSEQVIEIARNYAMERKKVDPNCADVLELEISGLDDLIGLSDLYGKIAKRKQGKMLGSDRVEFFYEALDDPKVATYAEYERKVISVSNLEFDVEGTLYNTYAIMSRRYAQKVIRESSTNNALAWKDEREVNYTRIYLTRKHKVMIPSRTQLKPKELLDDLVSVLNADAEATYSSIYTRIKEDMRVMTIGTMVEAVESSGVAVNTVSDTAKDRVSNYMRCVSPELVGNVPDLIESVILYGQKLELLYSLFKRVVGEECCYYKMLIRSNRKSASMDEIDEAIYSRRQMISYILGIKTEYLLHFKKHKFDVSDDKLIKLDETKMDDALDIEGTLNSLTTNIGMPARASNRVRTLVAIVRENKGVLAESIMEEQRRRLDNMGISNFIDNFLDTVGVKADNDRYLTLEYARDVLDNEILEKDMDNEQRLRIKVATLGFEEDFGYLVDKKKRNIKKIAVTTKTATSESTDNVLVMNNGPIRMILEITDAVSKTIDHSACIVYHIRRTAIAKQVTVQSGEESQFKEFIG